MSGSTRLRERRSSRFRGTIAGLGPTSGVRAVVGRWSESPYGAFACGDGVVQISVGSERHWHAFAPLVGVDPAEPRWATNQDRVRDRAALTAAIESSFAGRTRAELEVPEGPHSHLGKAVYFGTALAEPGDNDHVYIELWEAPV